MNVLLCLTEGFFWDKMCANEKDLHLEAFIFKWFRRLKIYLFIKSEREEGGRAEEEKLKQTPGRAQPRTL